jgi:hypothetical protein
MSGSFLITCQKQKVDIIAFFYFTCTFKFIQMSKNENQFMSGNLKTSFLNNTVSIDTNSASTLMNYVSVSAEKSSWCGDQK